MLVYLKKGHISPTITDINLHKEANYKEAPEDLFSGAFLFMPFCLSIPDCTVSCLKKTLSLSTFLSVQQEIFWALTHVQMDWNTLKYLKTELMRAL